MNYGIQGGKGSFNEEAARYYFKKNNISNCKLKYLYTSENVLKAIKNKEIDMGQFAIHNSVGGIVEESLQAMAKYTFNIVDQFEILISHAIMIRSDVNWSSTDTIMTHPQVLAQCRHNLKVKYPKLKLISGEGEMIDHARVAQALSLGELPSNIAVMGSKVLADIYDLKIIEKNLQDNPENYTSFLVVER